MVNWSWVCAHFIWQGKMKICWQQKWLSCHLVRCSTSSFQFEVYFPSVSEYCQKLMHSPLMTAINLIIYCRKCLSLSLIIQMTEQSQLIHRIASLIHWCWWCDFKFQLYVGLFPSPFMSIFSVGLGGEVLHVPLILSQPIRCGFSECSI